jgi:putative salt-induced outer membrane protein YdiY
VRALKRGRSRLAIRCGILSVLLLLCRADPGEAAIKTDVVELRNGDRITCELRKLERGKLTVKTDGLGTIAIEWDDVAQVASKATYDVELESGQRLFGSLERSDPAAVDVITLSGPERVTLASIVRISPIGGTFWSRLDGNLDAGFSFTQANVQTQWSFNSDIYYRSRRWLSHVGGDSALTTSEDADRQTRNTLNLRSQRFMGPRWSGLGFAQFQQNEELSLQLRAMIGAGFERVLLQSNRRVLAVAGGAAFTREEYQGADNETVAEAVAGVTWDLFTFDGRSKNLDVTLLSFYALNRPRARLELNSSFKSDIVGDLYWSINLFESYNSDPPEARKSSDFGISAALGWSF